MKNLVKTVMILMAFLPSILTAQDKPNIILITIDDLRPELGVYGNTLIQTPQIDALSEHATTFNNAFCQVPVCGASRASMHTGVRPTPKRFTSAGTEIDHDLPNAVTIGQHFKENGYYTFSIGKVIHGKKDAVERTWTEYLPAESMFEYHDKALVEEATNPVAPYKRPQPYEVVVDSKDTDFLDGRSVKVAKERLAELKKKDQPFFMAVGIARPHLPFVAPKRFWDLYNENDIPMADNPYKPKNMPEMAKTTYGELRAYNSVPKKGDVPNDLAKKLKHGYYASVSFSDYLVGDLVAELKKQGLYENSIIVIWGDHGWQLGEHSFWAKHTNFDIALRVPLIIKPQKGKNMKAAKADGFAEIVDIFPTLCDLAGLEGPSQLQGQSLVPVLKDPNFSTKEYALSRWKQGDSIRTKGFRYTAFKNKKGVLIAEMMYDLSNDPEENKNIVEDATYKGEVEKHRKLLDKALKEYSLI